MRANEFINEQIIDELDPGYVNQTIGQDPNWSNLGSGYTASVWQHLSEPDQVVKVVGGGSEGITQGEHRGLYTGTVALVHFLVDHGHLSTHFPIIHGINIDDNEVLQIRLEKLFPLEQEICNRLSDIVTSEKFGGVSAYEKVRLNLLIHDDGTRNKNDADSLVNAIKLLIKAAPIYAKAHKLDNIGVDLHGGNWLQRQDGTIVAADPWVSFD